MKCFYHPDRDAVNTCSRCGQPVCSECNYVTGTHPICGNCWKNQASGATEEWVKHTDKMKSGATQEVMGILSRYDDPSAREVVRPLKAEAETTLVKKENAESQSGENLFEFLVKDAFSKAFRSMLITSLSMVLIWEVLLFFLPGGWWIAVINILFFLGSVFFLFYWGWLALRMVLPGWLAFVCSLLLWFAIVVLIRSLIMSILEALFS